LEGLLRTKSDLVFVPGCAKIGAAAYVRRIMEPALVPFWYQCCEEYGWAIVKEDNAPGHKGYANRYRELNEMDVLEWPADSLTRGVFGLVIWRRSWESHGGEPSDVEALMAMLCIAWGNIKEVESMPARLQAVIGAGGAATAY